MATRRNTLSIAAMAILAVACGEPAAGPEARVTPSFSVGGVGRPTVLVNSNTSDNGTARTIQEGIDMVAERGTVMVLPGTYVEALVIDKGLTLQGIADGSGSVLIEQVFAAPTTAADAVIQVTAAAPVTIRNATVHHAGLRGLNASTNVDLVIERMVFHGEFPFPAPNFNNAVSVVNNATQSGGRARLAVRETRIHTEGIGVSIGGDVDAVVERNVVGGNTPGVPGACVFVSPTGQGLTVPAGSETNVEIVGNEFEECGTNLAGRIANGIQVVGVVGAATTGTVNIIGNTMRNTVRVAGTCNTAGINYQFYSGRIEHNTITNVVQGCATDVAQARPAAIWLGSRTMTLPPVNVTVRFNDIQGNVFAGLRIGNTQTVAVDASCNWWGASSGPSGLGTGSGDAVVVEAGGAMPAFTPFAAAPIAGTGAESC